MTPEAKENIAQVAKAANNLQDLIDGVLDLSKIESGEISLHMERVCLKKSLEGFLISGSKLAEEENVCFQYSIGDFAETEVLLDKLRVWQILSKLLLSAVKLSPEGGKVCFSAECEDSNGERSNCRFVIKHCVCADACGTLVDMLENGTGADREQFDDFDIAGMTMPLVKSLVEQMGGSITAESYGEIIMDGSIKAPANCALQLWDNLTCFSA